MEIILGACTNCYIALDGVDSPWAIQEYNKTWLCINCFVELDKLNDYLVMKDVIHYLNKNDKGGRKNING